MKTPKIIFTLLLLCCFFTGFATIEGLNGKWTGTLKTDQGDEYPLLYKFAISGDKLTGSAKTPKGDMPINDGVVKGNAFTFNVTVANMEIDHSGQFYGDSVAVDLCMGDAKAHTTLVREK